MFRQSETLEKKTFSSASVKIFIFYWLHSHIIFRKLSPFGQLFLMSGQEMTFFILFHNNKPFISCRTYNGTFHFTLGSSCRSSFTWLKIRSLHYNYSVFLIMSIQISSGFQVKNRKLCDGLSKKIFTFHFKTRMVPHFFLRSYKSSSFLFLY